MSGLSACQKGMGLVSLGQEMGMGGLRHHSRVLLAFLAPKWDKRLLSAGGV